MNRRELLTTTVATALPLTAGCSAIADEAALTYTLEIDGPLEEPEGNVLDYDTAGLSLGQDAIVEEAVRTGAYSEDGVWSTAPAREPISMEYRTVIQLIARHVGEDAAVDQSASFDTPSRYDETAYRSVVTVE